MNWKTLIIGGVAAVVVALGVNAAWQRVARWQQEKQATLHVIATDRITIDSLERIAAGFKAKADTAEGRRKVAVAARDSAVAALPSALPVGPGCDTTCRQNI